MIKPLLRGTRCTSCGDIIKKGDSAHILDKDIMHLVCPAIPIPRKEDAGRKILNNMDKRIASKSSEERREHALKASRTRIRNKKASARHEEKT